MTAAPTIAFVTMVRDDHFFLRLWVQHYARHVPRHHLFILLDGFDQTAPDFAAGCQIITLPRLEPGPGWDMRRWTMLADFNATLLGRFDVVVLNDVDELIIADPARGTPLLEALGQAREVGVITPFAVDVVHRYDICPNPLDQKLPVLQQRPHATVNYVYAKPCITSTPVRWNLGGHRSDHPKLHLDRRLFLFHLRFVDRDMLLARQATRNAIMQASENDQPIVAGSGWAKSTEDIDSDLRALQAHGLPVASDFSFERQRGRMEAGWRKDAGSNEWRVGRVYNKLTTYIIPERFHDLL